MQRRHRSPCPPSVVSPQYLTYEIGNTSNPTTNNNNGDDDPSELPRDLGRTSEAFCKLHPLRHLGLWGTVLVDVITISSLAQSLCHSDHKLLFLAKGSST